MPDRELPTVVDPEVARAAFLAHAPAALEGFKWEQETPLSILVWIEAHPGEGDPDRYLARFDFSYYPDWPPRVTFVDPKTKLPNPTAWPVVNGAPNIAFYGAYGDAPTGMVCNSMFFEYYFWGGHSPDDTIRWNARTHTFAASLNELRLALRSPYYVRRAA